MKAKMNHGWAIIKRHLNCRKSFSCLHPFTAALLLCLACGGVPHSDSATAVHYPLLHDSMKVRDMVEGKVRGYLTTPQELRLIRRRADDGIEPYHSAMRQVLRIAGEHQEWEPLSVQETCSSAHAPKYIETVSLQAYARSLAYHLTGEAHYAREVLQDIRRLLNVTSFGTPGNSSKPDRQCQLNLSWWVPGFIRAADLLEDVPEWRQSELKISFQDWLTEVIYPLISFSAEVSMSNWGSAATNCSAYITDYLWDRPDVLLVSYNRLSAAQPFTARSPAEAYGHATQLALGRMNGTRWEGEGGSSSACDFAADTKSMIRPDGGIPDELRRGSSSCAGSRILENDRSNMYSQTHLQHVLAHAELLWRRGDRRIYENIQQQALPLTYNDPAGKRLSLTLPAGRGSLRQALRFVLVAAFSPAPRALKSAAEIAYRYYRDPFLLAAVRDTRPNTGSRGSAFETLTHGFAKGESPAPPPTSLPPGYSDNPLAQSGGE